MFVTGRLPRLALIAIGLWSFGAPVRAVIVAGGDGTQNTTLPANPASANVGYLNGATGIYLGFGLVITASHVGAGTIYLNGQPYAAAPDSTVRLLNNDHSLADVVVFRIIGDPGLAPLTIAPVTPTTNSDVIMAGDGRNRDPNETQWTVTTQPGDNNDIWTEVPSGGDASGFKYGAGQSLRYGTNVVSSTIPGLVDDGAGLTQSFYTDFTENPLLRTASEAQAAPGDSGGAVFQYQGSTLTLTGVILAIGLFDGQPANTAVYGNTTYAADLSYYRNQIVTIPEPSALALGLGGLGSWLAFRRRR